MTRKPPRPKACKTCGNSFAPRAIGQTCCSAQCAIAFARKVEGVRVLKEARKVRAENKAAKKALREKDRSYWLGECERIANRYARVRDHADGCISCDRPANWYGQWHGSHYRPAGMNAAIRFNLWNIHKACSVCNNHYSGNPIPYKAKLEQKIGVDRVRWLESQNHPHRHSIEYLSRYRRVMGKRLKRMEAKLNDS